MSDFLLILPTKHEKQALQSIHRQLNASRVLHMEVHCMPVIPGFEKLRQENCKFQASVDYIVILLPKKRKKIKAESHIRIHADTVM